MNTEYSTCLEIIIIWRKCFLLKILSKMWCWVLSQKHFPQCDFPSFSFPNVLFPKLRCGSDELGLRSFWESTYITSHLDLWLLRVSNFRTIWTKNSSKKGHWKKILNDIKNAGKFFLRSYFQPFKTLLELRVIFPVFSV